MTDRHAVVEALAGLTGGWASPSGDTNSLARARNLVAASLLAGIKTEDLSPVSKVRQTLSPANAADRDAAEALLKDTHPSAAASERAWVRTPLDLDPAVSAAAA